MAALQRRAWEEREASFILWALWKKRLESPSSFAVYDPRRLRASGRDGGGVMNRPPSPLTCFLSRHTSWIGYGINSADHSHTFDGRDTDKL